MLIEKLFSGRSLARRSRFLILGAGLATALAACHPARPAASVSALSYPTQQLQPGAAGDLAASRRVLSTAQPSNAPAAASAEPGSTNDPLYRLDMP